MLIEGIPSIEYNGAMKTKRTDLAADLRRAMKRDGRTVYAVARDAEVPVGMIQRFSKGGGLTLATASRLCDLFGLQLRPVDGRKGR